MGVGRWDREGGRGRKEKRWRQSKLLPNLLGHLTASDHLASSSSPFLLLWREQRSLRFLGKNAPGRGGQENPPTPNIHRGSSV